MEIVATHIEDTQRLVREIEMLKVALYFMSRKSEKKEYNLIIFLHLFTKSSSVYVLIMQ
jgi:hypothetical protein